jgi:large subunit ribosomal protein L18
MSTDLSMQARRRQRLRYQLRQKSTGRPRLSVFRSGKHIYAQIIDDAAVVFDRGSYLYHGRVKALAEAAREGGLDF